MWCGCLHDIHTFDRLIWIFLCVNETTHACVLQDGVILSTYNSVVIQAQLNLVMYDEWPSGLFLDLTPSYIDPREIYLLSRVE